MDHKNLCSEILSLLGFLSAGTYENILYAGQFREGKKQSPMKWEMMHLQFLDWFVSWFFGKNDSSVSSDNNMCSVILVKIKQKKKNTDKAVFSWMNLHFM